METVVTHDGEFHADDVFAVATLQLLRGSENIRVMRTRDQKIIAKGDWVLDVGGEYNPEQQRFDHHQNGAPVRPNGIPYAAFGLVWKHFGEHIAGSPEDAEFIEQNLVLPIDADDVGVRVFTRTGDIAPFHVPKMISLFNPAWGTQENSNSAFARAVDVARNVLERALKHAEAHVLMQTAIRQVYEKASEKSTLIFNISIPSEAFIDYPDVQIIVCPDNPGVNENWRAVAIRQNHDTFETRVQFPLEWAGLRGKELADVSGIADAVFCHKMRFIFVAGSKESALASTKFAQ